ncbi:CcoQ/FixQ family Cbb3-type cytochrome c oxidase assembly chaperone [Paraphotobacterium marinum]|uniref:CcoQ/FixQ family Cbb3-type cytochrome c oxidase assembly chaperone n=1 Tax=Paraphotobacterium marinum TaxID=1755811 RepID=A0A220VEG1_9GAMM|nr:CcoQ/FixQ family Cbb3-type cytochrome c oxidase assembly chaperone [Paraphotobacterium marinum]ASK78784.1 CcoQ/FixQ family Cbb3-type cytochrome c oxidase assembly chaperone [Paraphotobacterium marinum]
MNILNIHIIWTIVIFITIIGIIFWAFSRKNKSNFEQIAKSILDSDQSGKEEK